MGQERKQTKLSDLRPSDMFPYYAPEKGVSDEIPEWARRRALKTHVDTKKKLGNLPRRVTPKAKKKLKLRTKKEIFGGKECQEWYMEKLSEALERPNGDDLYEFIKAHPKYGKTSYLAWNKDFAVFVGLDPDDEEYKKYKGATEAITNRRITAAAQHVLAEKYDNDIFRLTYTKKQFNPWIFVDGKMGPYTVSVLNDYWMAKYSKNSKKKPQPPGRSGLDDDDYKPGSASAKSWDDALEHLDTQTGKGPVEEDEAETEDRPTSKPFKLTEAQKKNAKRVLPKLRQVLRGMKIPLYLEEDKIMILTTYMPADPEAISSTLVLMSLGSMIKAGQITDKEIGEAKRRKKKPAKKPKPKEEEEQEDPADTKAKARYARLDISKKRPIADYAFDAEEFNTKVNLSTALAEVYMEDANPRNPLDSHQTFRVLNLVAQKIGAKIDGIRIEKGESLELTEDGVLKITTDDGEITKYTLDLSSEEISEARKGKKKTKKPKSKKEEEPYEDEADTKAKARYARLDIAKKRPISDYAFDAEEFNTKVNLSTALSEVYSEDPKPRNTLDSHQTFHILNLVAQKIGAKIDGIRIEKGESLELTEDGELKIASSDGETTKFTLDLS